jgi:hypothetical protein
MDFMRHFLLRGRTSEKLAEANVKVEEGFPTGVTTPVFGHVQNQMVPASTKDCAAGENLKTPGRRLFVSLKRRI